MTPIQIEAALLHSNADAETRQAVVEAIRQIVQTELINLEPAIKSYIQSELAAIEPRLNLHVEALVRRELHPSNPPFRDGVKAVLQDAAFRGRYFDRY